VRESSSDRLARALSEDPAIVTWWGSGVECVSALARLERDAAMDRVGMVAAMQRLRAASASWAEVPASLPVREQAMRLLRVHPMRAGDALQLAAAIVAADFQPSSLEFVTLDSRQAAAAEREGFRVIA
jgi:predicted nucleic acid-binding protein